MQSRRADPSDVSEEEWARVAPDLTLPTEAAGQRDHGLRAMFNGQRYVVRRGAVWRAMPHGPPPWHAAYDRAQRWLRAGCFDSLVHDLRAVLRLASGRAEGLSAVVLDSRTLRSTTLSGARAAWEARPGGRETARGQARPSSGACRRTCCCHADGGSSAPLPDDPRPPPGPPQEASSAQGSAPSTTIPSMAVGESLFASRAITRASTT